MQVKQITGSAGNLTVETKEGAALADVDCLLWSIGGRPNTADLGLDKAGIKADKAGHIEVDAFQNTSAGNVYAVGDVTGAWQLTPGKVFNSSVVFCVQCFRLGLQVLVDYCRRVGWYTNG